MTRADRAQRREVLLDRIVDGLLLAENGGDVLDEVNAIRKLLGKPPVDPDEWRVPE